MKNTGKHLLVIALNVYKKGVRYSGVPGYYVPKSSIVLAGTGVWKISSVTCVFSSIKIDSSTYPKSLISRKNEVYVFFNKILIYRQRHVITHVIKVDPRCTSVVRFHGISRNWPRQFRLNDYHELVTHRKHNSLMNHSSHHDLVAH